MPNINRIDFPGLEEIHDKIIANERLSFQDGLKLFHSADITAIGALADYARRKRHGNATTYVVNRQINYSNICKNHCKFCAFRRNDINDNGAYELSHEEIIAKITAACQTRSLDELHIVGGCHPTLTLQWFEELLSTIHFLYPDLPIKAFTPVEIEHFASMENCSTREVLQRLKACGLTMMPGGGAEIFDETLRKQICPEKASADKWLKIGGEAHELGIKTNCTMLFGHLETYEQRLDHLLRLRAQQDKSGGYTCFIPLPFLKKGNSLQLPPRRQGPVEGIDRLKTIAISRLMLDNIPHIKAYWVMLGVKLAQTALHFGADDLDGTIIEERIGHMAGATTSQELTLEELEHMIRMSGFIPVRRNARFEAV